MCVFALRPDFTLVDVNQFAADVTGRTRSELIGTSAINLLHPDDLSLVLDAVGIINVEPWRASPAQFRIVDSTGRVIPMDMRAQVVDPPLNGISLLVTAQPAIIADHVDRFVTATTAHSPLRTSLRPLIDAIEANGHYAAAMYWIDEFMGDAQFVANQTPAGTLMTWPPAVRELRSIAEAITDNQPVFRTLTELPLEAAQVEAAAPYLSASVHPVRIGDTFVGFILGMTKSSDRLGDFGKRFMVRMTELATVAITQHQISMRLRRQALTDPLTGLANRTALFESCEENRSGSLSIVDVDQFKSINDTHGHTVGDTVLVEISRRLVELVGSKGLVARLGGDEFAIILREHTIEQAGELLRKAFAYPVETSVGSLVVRGSFGSADLEANESITAALARADHAMYDSKRKRTGRRHTAMSDLDQDLVTVNDLFG
jgi:diguanylate cyclase (GGDEF)-like protein